MVRFSDLVKHGLRDDESAISRVRQVNIAVANTRAMEARAQTDVSEDARQMGVSAERYYQALITVLTKLAQFVRMRKSFKVEAIGQLIEKIVKQPGMIDQLFHQAMFSTHQGPDLIIHSVNVCIYSLKLVLGLNYSTRQMVEIGLLGLLEDVGMHRLPEELLNKESGLTDKEFTLMQRHTEFSYEIISSLGPEYQWMAQAAFQVHERDDGSGYPNGLKGKDISEYAKVIAVVDTFEAMTHNRPHRPGMLGYTAIQQILRTSKGKFSSNILKMLLTQLSVFPLNSLVKLNNGAIGMVIGTNNSKPLNPTVKLIYDGQGRKVAGEKIIDLAESQFLFIKDAVSENELPLD